MSEISIRALNQADWAAFRELRLRALRTEPGKFFASYSEEVGKAPDEWQQTIAGSAHQVFGLFDDQRLIGITAVFTWREDPTGETAILAMSFILPEYRGRGASKLLYRARFDWIRAQPQFKRIVVSHRESNQPSRKAIEHHGFLFLKRTERTWPDGTTEDELSYELRVR
jgi:RimJ/RimL family protein N-acetyltransferase